jgi:hypothetical protein
MGFVDSGTVFPPAIDLVPIPMGQPEAGFATAGKFNGVYQALYDTRSWLLGGQVLGFSPQTGTPAFTGLSLYSLFVRDSDKHLIYNQNGVLVDLQAGGGGTPTLQQVYDNDPSPLPVTLTLSNTQGFLEIDSGTLSGPGGKFLRLLDSGAQLGSIDFDFDGSIVCNIAKNHTALTTGFGLWLVNYFAATNGTQQFSPQVQLTGFGFATGPAASREVDWLIQVRPIQGAANPTSDLVLASQINLSGWVEQFAFSDGIPRWSNSANIQTTVGAAGGASAVPASPTKYLKVQDNTGTTLVVPAFAAV